jgi:glycosyltransferase involved in cell wall biosynthesis
MVREGGRSHPGVKGRPRPEEVRPVRRVLVVSRMFPHPEAPLSGPFVHEQVLALRRRGVDARVLCGRPFPMGLRRPLGVPGRWRAYRRAWDGLAWQEHDGVPVLYAPHHVGWFARLLRRDDPYRDAVVGAGLRLRRGFDFDLVHAHTAHPDGSAALALARLCRRPLVITEHTGPFASLTAEPARRRKALGALAAARRVWCVSDALTREVAGYFPPGGRGHIRTLYNGVDAARFRPPARWRPDPAAPRFLFVGLLVWEKNLPLLLEAFARLRRVRPGATLGLAGDGPLRADLGRRAAAPDLAGGVRFFGPCARAEVARLLRVECDALVLPSKFETFGVVLIEALASGKPVVASRCGGPQSVVTAPFLGALCAPDDVGTLAAALGETAARLRGFDPARIRAHAVAKFDYRNLAAALAGQYEEILAAPACGPAAA